MAESANANAEAIEAWDGVLFERFSKFREIAVTALGSHGAEAMRRHPPAPGDRVLDIGCGFGDSTIDLARLAGPDGRAHGIDAAPRFIEAARSEAADAGVENVSFAVGDVQSEPIEGRFDLAFARFGTMFFASPVAAMRNVAGALDPGGRLCIVVWRRKLDNMWMHAVELAVERFGLEENVEDEPTCGPGPFSMANADTVADILIGAGFEDIALERCDITVKVGNEMAQAVEFATALGPAGEAIRLAGEQAEALRPQIESAAAEALSQYLNEAGEVWAPSSTWIITASVPAA